MRSNLTVQTKQHVSTSEPLEIYMTDFEVMFTLELGITWLDCG